MFAGKLEMNHKDHWWIRVELETSDSTKRLECLVYVNDCQLHKSNSFSRSWLGSEDVMECCFPFRAKHKQTNSMAFSPQENYTDWATATGRRNLVPTFADRGVSRGQPGGSPTVVSHSFVDRSRYFSFK
jgi:hypothetical protein